jgi:hypothetical protein
MEKKSNTSVKDAIVEIAKSLENVFKKYTKNTRTKAWEKITSKDGEKEIKKILNDPSRQTNTFQKLATQKNESCKFSKWLELREDSEESEEVKNYMFFSNLKAIKEKVDKLLQIDPKKLDKMIEDGHDWASDHISSSRDDIEEVYNWISGEVEQ